MKSRKIEIKQIIIVMGIIFSLNFLSSSSFNSYQGKSDRFIETVFNPKTSSSNQYQLEWYRLWDDTGWQTGRGLVVDSFKNIYQTGRSGNDGILYKIDSSGNQLWNRSWGSSNDDWSLDIALDSNNYIYLVGTTDKTQVNHGEKIIILKYDSTGN